MPRVSILCSVYNGEMFLRECLESVLRQDFSDFEFLIVDDSSSDRTPFILEEFAARDSRLRLVRNAERKGLTLNLNTALSLAKGEYVARLDADDLVDPGRLSRQVRWLDSHPECALLGSRARLIDESGRAIGWTGQSGGTAFLRWLSLFSNPFIHGSVMMRRAFLEQRHIRYDPAFAVSQDYDLWLRLLPLTEAACLPAPLYALRLHGGSVSALKKRQQKRNTFLALSRFLLREFGFSLSYRDFLIWRGCLCGDGYFLGPRTKIRHTPRALFLYSLFLRAFFRRYGFSLPVLFFYGKGAIAPLLRPLRYGDMGAFFRGVVCFLRESAKEVLP